MQGQPRARYRNAAGENNKIRQRYIGRKNEFGQIDLCRNAIFEPSEMSQKDWADACLKDISIAFRWHHPAIICSHRVNFVGTINIDNRDRNLKSFDLLLKQIQKQWPDVEFMSSDQLGDLIAQK